MPKGEYHKVCFFRLSGLVNRLENYSREEEQSSEYGDKLDKIGKMRRVFNESIRILQK